MGNSKFTIEKPDLLIEIKKEKTKKEILKYFTKQVQKEMNEDDIVVAWEKYKNAKSLKEEEYEAFEQYEKQQ